MKSGASREGDRRLLTGFADAAGRGRADRGELFCPGPQDRLPRRLLGDDEQAAVWWLGAHGGAGESTLEELFSGSRAAGHSWPVTAANVAPARVVLVARTHAHGLRAAQSAIREWAAGRRAGAAARSGADRRRARAVAARAAAAGRPDRGWRPGGVVACRGSRRGGSGSRRRRTTRRRSSAGCSRTCEQ